jgi:hypothetical protein
MLKMYVEANTNNKHVTIDVLELKLQDETIITLDWNESLLFSSDSDFNGQFIGISYCSSQGEEDYQPASGKINMFEEAVLSHVEVYSDTCAECSNLGADCSCNSIEFTITGVYFEDGEQRVDLSRDSIAKFYE